MPRFAANLSMLYPEMDFTDRFAAAARDGFRGVEYLFPYAHPADRLATLLHRHGLQQVLFNAPRLEWLPLEALCYSACQAENRLTLSLAPGAECIAWDVTALGLPHSGQPFAEGRFTQHIEVPGIWMERGTIDAADALLMGGRLGLAGHRCLASVFFVAGEALPRERREAALDAARAVIDAHALRDTAGATSPHPQVVVVRVLAPVVEPAMELLRQAWGAWRTHLWGLPARLPRIWAM